MAVLPILTYPDPILRRVCEPVTEVTDELRRMFNDMADTMYEAPGIGLAAAQVGCPHRLIVVDLGDDEETGRAARLYKMANPVIVERSEPIDSEEGCLSLPTIRGTVPRHDHVIVEGIDEAGRPLRVEARGLLAYCFQHEIDHLDGVLFIDHLSRLQRSLVKTKLDKRLKREGKL